MIKQLIENDAGEVSVRPTFIARSCRHLDVLCNQSPAAIGVWRKQVFIVGTFIHHQVGIWDEVCSEWMPRDNLVSPVDLFCIAAIR